MFAAGLIVSFPNMFKFFGFDAGAVVNYFAVHFFSPFTNIEKNLFIFPAVFDGIAQKVGKHLLYLIFITFNIDIMIVIDIQTTVR